VVPIATHACRGATQVTVTITTELPWVFWTNRVAAGTVESASAR
jgi:hypothetical protein